MITIFTIPKPFTGRMAAIQHNAIESWRHVMDCEVLLMGDEAGVADYAVRHGLQQIADVARTPHGTPLLDDVWRKASEAAQHPVLAYLNCDIMLAMSLSEIAGRIPLDAYLGVCRRWDVDLEGEWDFSEGWEKRLVEFAHTRGSLRHGRAVECHLFPRDAAFGDMLPFAVGRNRYDNWLVLRALEKGIPVVDMTPVLPVIHQNHERHVPGISDAAYQEELRENHRLAGGFKELATSYDATHMLDESGLQPNRGGVAACFYRSVRSICAAIDV